MGGDALGFAKVLLRAHECVKQASRSPRSALSSSVMGDILYGPAQGQYQRGQKPVRARSEGTGPCVGQELVFSVRFWVSESQWQCHHMQGQQKHP